MTPTDPAAIEALRASHPESWQDALMYSERQLQAAVAAERARSAAELESLREQREALLAENAYLSGQLDLSRAMGSRLAEIPERSHP